MTFELTASRSLTSAPGRQITPLTTSYNIHHHAISEDVSTIPPVQGDPSDHERGRGCTWRRAEGDEGELDLLAQGMDGLLRVANCSPRTRIKDQNAAAPEYDRLGGSADDRPSQGIQAGELTLKLTSVLCPVGPFVLGRLGCCSCLSYAPVCFYLFVLSLLSLTKCPSPSSSAIQSRRSTPPPA
jgi:hypothetical protein